MGCGGSKVPREILPDPTAGQENKFLCKKKSVFGSDFEVFKDFDDKKKWLFIDKKGSIFKDPVYILENYVREEGKKFGQTLCAAKIGDAKVKIYGADAHEDSDASQDYSVSGGEDGEGGMSVDKSTVVTNMKWAQTLKVKFYSDRERKVQIAEMKVKAKGKAKKKVTTVTVTDDEGNSSSSEKTDIKKKVKKLIYKFQFEPTVEGGAQYDVVLKGSLNGKESGLEWQSPLFHATTRGGFNQKAEIVTSFSNPGLGLLVGFLCAVELAPQDIADNVKVW
jgi:hypothetical protein